VEQNRHGLLMVLSCHISVRTEGNPHTTSVMISGDLAVIQTKKLLSTRLEY